MQKIGETGFEPDADISERLVNKELTENSKTATDQKLPKDLQQVIDRWPELPEHIKAAIKALVQIQ